MDYKIVSGLSAAALTAAVRAALAEGWEPQGGPFVGRETVRPDVQPGRWVPASVPQDVYYQAVCLWVR